jgi:hypothetical protein
MNIIILIIIILIIMIEMMNNYSLINYIKDLIVLIRNI